MSKIKISSINKKCVICSVCASLSLSAGIALMNTQATSAEKAKSAVGKDMVLSQQVQTVQSVKYSDACSVFSSLNSNSSLVSVSSSTVTSCSSSSSVSSQSSSLSAESYSSEDLYWLSHVIYAEAGDLSDKAELYVGSVVLNRVNQHKSEFGLSIKEVISKHGQYASFANGHVYNEPDDRAVQNAKVLLTSGSKLPVDVLFQSEYKLGRLYEKVDTEYFCYAD